MQRKLLLVVMGLLLLLWVGVTLIAHDFEDLYISTTNTEARLERIEQALGLDPAVPELDLGGDHLD